MKRFLSAVSACLFLFTVACANQQPSTKNSEALSESAVKNIRKDKELIEKIFKSLAKRGIVLDNVTVVNDAYRIPGYDVFMVALKDLRQNVRVKRYVWISKDRKHVIFDVFAINNGEKLSISPVRPKNSVEKLKVDLSWLKEVDEELKSLDIPHVIGKGNRNKIYVVWDVYCPFCYKHFGELPKKAEELNVEIHMLPLAVHGKSSINGFVYFAQLAREMGLKEALSYLYSLGNGDFRKYVKKLEKESEEKLASMPKEKRRELESFFRRLKDKLLSKGIHATPSIVYVTDRESNRGYVITGFKPLEEVLKMK